MIEERRYDFVQVDVFTTQRFGGNPLAVFLDGQGLSDEEMQNIALEMNLSETTFVLPPGTPDHAARVRIFTTSNELPFAGHPTIGTAWVLANQGRIPDGVSEITLELGIGPIVVTFQGPTSNPDFLWMQQGEATFGSILDERAALAAAIGLDADDLAPTLPIQPGSTGVSFLYVPLASREAVDRAAPRPHELWPIMAQGGSFGLFLFASEPGSNRVYSRMLVIEEHTTWEDPATGSASGPLGAYLVQHGVATGDGDAIEIISEQGTRMGRQSFVHIRVATEDGRPGRVEVGGSVVPVLEGTLAI